MFCGKLSRLALGVLFVVNCTTPQSIAQELPPIISRTEAIDRVCLKWVGRTISAGEQTVKLNAEVCKVLVDKMVLGMEQLVVGLTMPSREMIRGDKSLNEVRASFIKEGMQCGSVSTVSNSYFTALRKSVRCIYDKEMRLEATFYGDESEIAGGLEINVSKIRNAISIPQGSIGELMMDAFDFASKAVVPGHGQLAVEFYPPKVSYKEYYLRRPLSTKSGKWAGYVIKVTDYGMLKGHERLAKMIFPTNLTYGSENQCYREFKRLISVEPMNSRYPQTSDPMTSYLFGCVER